MVVIEEDEIHENEANNKKTLCDDIVEQILLKLPVKSLLRFKAACKSWCNLISDPRFSNLTICRDHNVSRIHLSGYNYSHRVDLEKIEREAFHDEVYGNEEEEEERPWYFSVPSIDGDCSDIQIVEFCNPFYHVPNLYSIHVAGSCNGLLFVAIWDDTFLWNPSTREHIQLPPTKAKDNTFLWNPSTREHIQLPPTKAKDNTFLWNPSTRVPIQLHPAIAKDDTILFSRFKNKTITGLGYNSVFDEYKAILILVEYSNWTPDVCFQLLIYTTSKVGYWKEVVDQDVPAAYCFCTTLGLGITVNGCPHWIVHDHCKDVIKFGDHYKRLTSFVKTISHSLNVLGRCLCATLENSIDNTTDVWVMNEYGVEDSWNKLFVIPVSIIQGFRIVPLGFMNHGDELVLEVNKEKIMTYNRKTEARKFVIGTSSTTERCTFFQQRGDFNSVDYVMSSVSPCRFLREEK